MPQGPRSDCKCLSLCALQQAQVKGLQASSPGPDNHYIPQTAAHWVPLLHPSSDYQTLQTKVGWVLGLEFLVE